jgi:hypothetical protein
MLLNSFYAILGTFYTLLNNTDLDLSYFDLSYVFPGHSDSVERGLTVCSILAIISIFGSKIYTKIEWLSSRSNDLITKARYTFQVNFVNKS